MLDRLKRAVGVTTDRNDPRLGHGIDDAPVPQHEVYLVAEDKGEFVEPVRVTYVHVIPGVPAEQQCRARTTMSIAIAETYARDPKFYGATYCCGCNMHRPVSEFLWANPNSGGATAQRVGETTAEMIERRAREAVS